jgi:hypothetical protein
MRTANGVASGSNSPEPAVLTAQLKRVIEGGNPIELFHSLIRLFCVCEQYSK